MVSRVLSPVRRRALVVGILQILPRAVLNQNANNVEVPGERGLMQRRRMRVKSNGVISIRIFSSLEQLLRDLGVAVLTGHRECDVTRFGS